MEVLLGFSRVWFGLSHNYNRKAYAWSRAHGRTYMHNVHVCLYA